MANISETSTWEANIYQIETTDPVEGGAGGISNAQAQALANRTKYLYDENQDQQDDIDALLLAASKFFPKNRGYITGIDINAHLEGHSYSVNGQITSAIIVVRNVPSETIEVTMPNSMGSINYKVNFSPQGLGDLDVDNSIRTIVWKPISATKFRFILQELAGANQNLRIHFEAIPLD